MNYRRYSVKTLVLVWASLGLLAILSVQLLVRAWVERPELERIQYVADMKDVQRVDAVYNSILEAVANRARDHAKWDSAYQFVSDQNKAFLRENFVADAFVDNQFTGAAFFDLNKKLLHATSYQQDSKTFSHTLPFSPAVLANKIFADTHGAAASHSSMAPMVGSVAGGGRNGFLLTAEGLVAIAVEEVTPSSFVGPSRGYLLLWRKIDPELTSQIARQVGLSFTVSLMGPDDVVLASTSKDSIARRDKNGKISWALNNINDEPIVKNTLSFSDSYYEDELITASVLAELATAIILVLASILIVNKAFIAPLVQLSSGTRSIVESKNYRSEITMSAAQEFEQVALQFNELLRAVYDQEMVLQTQNLKLRLESIRDPLTGISNRRYLDEYLDSCWKWSLEESKPFALVLMDVDSFKAYNDNYGHPAGDKVLKSIATLLKNSVDSSHGTIARYGGEEFCAVLIEKSEQQVRWWCKEVLDEIALLEIEHKYTERGYVSISIGVAFGTAADYHQLRQFFQIADTELYRSKSAGKNCMNFADVA